MRDSAENTGNRVLNVFYGLAEVEGPSVVVLAGVASFGSDGLSAEVRKRDRGSCQKQRMVG